jgi:Rhs element Vgr protein
MSLIPGQSDSPVITAKVYINGVVLGTDVSLMEISVSCIFNKIAGAKLRFLSGADTISSRNNVLSNDDRFKPGNEIKVQLGYDGTADTVFEGIIIKHGIKYSYSGGPELLIEAKDKAIRLTGARKSAYFIQKTDSDIIQQLAAGLSPEVGSTSYTHKQAVQFDVTDWDFLLMRAEAAGMLVHTDNNKLVVKKPVIAAPVITATIGNNVRDFEADMDARKVAQSITSQSWDYSQQTLEASQAGAAVFSEAGNISASELGAVIGAEPKLSHTGHLEQTQLQDWTDAADMRRLLAKIAGRLRIDGSAALKPGVSMKLDGFSDRFNGNVFVTGVQHYYNGMWYSDVQFGLRDDWFYKKEDVMDKPAKGLLAGVNGLQIGVVMDVSDPDSQYRVKVKLPMVGDEEAIWARVATLDAGDQHGSYFRPQIGDEAVLGFLNDDPREALILGYLHNKDTQASPLPVDNGALQYGFITKEGVKLILDDTNRSMKLMVTTSSGGKSIIINDSSGAMELKDEHGNTIKMEASGITIQAGKGNVTIKGTQVLIN